MRCTLAADESVSCWEMRVRVVLTAEGARHVEEHGWARVCALHAKLFRGTISRDRRGRPIQ